MNYKALIPAVLIMISLVAAGVFMSGCLDPKNKDSRFSGESYSIIPFESKEELENYWKSVDTEFGTLEKSFSLRGGTGGFAIDSTGPAPNIAVNEDFTSLKNELNDRHSNTNVQVQGVDEADVLKTDGKRIYYKTAPSYFFYKYESNDSDTYVPEKVWVIDALPPEAAEIVSQINETNVEGFYLIDENIVLMMYDGVKCYNISDPKNPDLLWETPFNPDRKSADTDDKDDEEFDYEKYIYTSYSDSRVVDGNLYLITSQSGPYYPVLYGMPEIPADKIYAPVLPGGISDVPENKYIVSKVDLKTGFLEDSVVILGNWDTTIYASGSHFYIASHYVPDYTTSYINFLKESGREYLPEDVIKHISRVLDNEDFSTRAKIVQIREIIQDYMESLSFKERKNVEKDFHNAFDEYYSRILVEKEKVGITRINLKTMDISSGEVPGGLLNRYSMDEYNGYLRVGVSIGKNWRMKDQTTNGVYVLDSDMEQIGYIDGIAKGERIYSTRFAGDVLYMVTFKEVDPFFVIDLSNPKNPEIMGELKIPGYSTYMHPVGDNLVVGVGRIENNSKLSLFDVSDPKNPEEISQYTFKEYTSLDYDFHAFLWDDATKTLVIPAENHAYIFHVDRSGITLKKDDVHDKNSHVSRTLYINDCLYTFSEKNIHIYNMSTWERVKTIDFPTEVYDRNDKDFYHPMPIGKK